MSKIAKNDEYLSDKSQISTKEAILTATCELVARKGLQGTTVRDITSASGANVAAVNYHFQSKDNLIAQATRHITEAVNLERERRLDAFLIETNGAPLSGLQILRALIEPIHDVSRASDGGSLYARVSSQLRTLRYAQESQDHFQKFGQTAHRIIGEMARSFPALTQQDLVEHYEFARGTALHMAMAFDPEFRRIELLLEDSKAVSHTEKKITLDASSVARIIAMIERSFGQKSL